MGISLKVAVIGAGFSGLRAAYELQREGHRVDVFEKAQRLGGTWVHDPRVEADELSLDPNRETIHNSLYHSLRTNLPRDLMGFSDFLFERKEYGDPTVFPGHEEVLNFLEDFAKEFKLTELIRYNTEVVQIERVELKNDEWVVESRTSGLSLEEVFEAVVVCNGQYSEPRFADDIPGIKEWPKKQVHSHNYRVPEPFRDQIVVVIGMGASAFDITRELATVAKEVHLSSRSPYNKVSRFQRYNNIWQHSKIDCIYENGRVSFEDGFSTEADVIFHCTGKNRYTSMSFPPQLAPRLSFIAIPKQTVVTRMIELQSKWIAQALSGKVLLPSEEEMLADVEEDYRHMEEGSPKHHAHYLHFQLDYLDWIAAQVGSPLEERLKKIFGHHIEFVFHSGGDDFRDILDYKNF